MDSRIRSVAEIEFYGIRESVLFACGVECLFLCTVCECLAVFWFGSGGRWSLWKIASGSWERGDCESGAAVFWLINNSEGISTSLYDGGFYSKIDLSMPAVFMCSNFFSRSLGCVHQSYLYVNARGRVSWWMQKFKKLVDIIGALRINFSSIRSIVQPNPESANET